MKRMTFALTLLTVAGIAIYSVVAQPPAGGRGPGGGPDGFRPPVHPLEEALDTDGDHQLSAKEIENAVAALKTLDKNENGKIDEDELRPRFAGRPGGPGFGGPGRGGLDGPEGRGPGPDGAPPRDAEAGRPGNAGEALARIMSFDKNEDGQISKDELPERMQGMFDRGDANGDGVLDKEELARIVAAMQGLGQGRGPDAGPQGQRGPDGPPSPEMIVENALRFDADGDEKLNRQELMEFARQMIQFRGGQRRPEGRGPDGGDRPDARPQRPDAE